ncbi:hypothetical protein EMIT0158MI4_20548 [Burkholderia ambifaria]
MLNATTFTPTPDARFTVSAHCHPPSCSKTCSEDSRDESSTVTGYAPALRVPLATRRACRKNAPVRGAFQLFDSLVKECCDAPSGLTLAYRNQAVDRIRLKPLSHGPLRDIFATRYPTRAATCRMDD